MSSNGYIMLLRTPIDIGSAIRDRRRRLGLGQDELAVRVGVSRKWIIDVEKGKPRVALDLLLRTLDALGLHLSIDGDGVPATRKRGKAVPTVDIDRVLDSVRAKRK
jgi:HTH-type transcriptional regulator/antitoxin HipB